MKNFWRRRNLLRKGLWPEGNFKILKNVKNDREKKKFDIKLNILDCKKFIEIKFWIEIKYFWNVEIAISKFWKIKNFLFIVVKILLLKNALILKNKILNRILNKNFIIENFNNWNYEI